MTATFRYLSRAPELRLLALGLLGIALGCAVNVAPVYLAAFTVFVFAAVLLELVRLPAGVVWS